MLGKKRKMDIKIKEYIIEINKMNKEELQQKIAEYYKKLTPDAQMVFSSNAWLDKLQIISDKYKLTDEQTQILGTETMLVLLGIISVDEYEKVLWDEFKLSETITHELSSEIDIGILKTIRPQLIKIFYKNNKPTTEKLKETIKTEMFKLPKETQEIIESFGWEKIIEEIGKKYLLNPNQINDLQDQVGLILTEAIDLSFIVSSIENNIDVNEEKAIVIAEELVQKIFRPMAIQLIGNIKKNLPIRNIHWRQNLDFILSGGDYTAFIRRVEPVEEGRKLKVESIPSKVDDLKSKFTI